MNYSTTKPIKNDTFQHIPKMNWFVLIPMKISHSKTQQNQFDKKKSNENKQI